MRTAGFVLTGGRSSRMGRDKALLPWGSQTLVEHIAHKVQAAAGRVALVGKSCGYGLDCLPDLHPGLGPMAGIEAALASGRAELNLILACDMPEVGDEWLSTLLYEASRRDAPCVITRDSDGRVHPLCGVYRSSCLPDLRRALAERRLCLRNWTEEMSAVHMSAAVPIGNVNTPDEWDRWRQTDTRTI